RGRFAALSRRKAAPTGRCSASAQRSVEKHHHRKPAHQPWVMEPGAALGIKVEPALEALKVAVHI
ncbi:hypothetical protein OO254_16325, partial [Pseudomonas sp. DCB_BG]|nr:hypothetical protein [Pseudomonas sp. DCB_BG]